MKRHVNCGPLCVVHGDARDTSLAAPYVADYARQRADEAHPAYRWGTRAFGFVLGAIVGAVLWAAWGLPEVWLW